MTALDQAWIEWGKSTLLAKWKAANPGEWQKLNAYRLGGPRPDLATPVGKALVYETDAWFDTMLGDDPPTPPPAPSGFVTRSGSQLMLDGKPFTFRGINCYGALGKCGPSINLHDVPEGITLRFWAFPSQVMEGWGNLDALIFDAKVRNIRLFPVLRNYGPDCNGLIIDEQLKAWAGQIAGRYKNETTILAWQIGNELIKDQAWYESIATVIRQNDPNHLVSYGAYNDQYRSYVNALDGMVDCHDYGQGSISMPTWLAQRITATKQAGVPVIVGESGISTEIEQHQRRDWFKAKMDMAFNMGASGYLFWGWQTTDGFGIGPGDPCLELLA